MKCSHSKVESSEWTQCPDCGKTVRYVRKNQKIQWTLVMLLLWFVGDPLASWALRILHLEAHNPRNLTHALLCGVFSLPIWILVCRFIPDHEEKPPTEE